MINVFNWKKVHLVGIGGISMSAVAKLLLHQGVHVTGSDRFESEITKELESLGVSIFIGPHNKNNVSDDVEAIIHTSASQKNNIERVVAQERGLPDINNFQFLGLWFKSKKIILVTGTHGKSTTTALLGEICIAGGLDPTVLVGSKVPGWKDHNLRLGNSDLVIIEGDEYAKHFLEFHPDGIIINNLELDHFDIYPDLKSLTQTFSRLLNQMKREGMVVANGEVQEIKDLLKPLIAVKRIKHLLFGREFIVDRTNIFDLVKVEIKTVEGRLLVTVDKDETYNLESNLIGEFNGMNIAGAFLMARYLGVDKDVAINSIKHFKGIWRRMELVSNKNNVLIYSDYGHHPTAVQKVVKAVRNIYPNKRFVLCFQPHHRNRVKHLIKEFSVCFDGVDHLVLVEVYDVAGRNNKADEAITSKIILQNIKNRKDNGIGSLEYSPTPEKAIDLLFKIIKKNDVVVVMGAGDIDKFLRKKLK